MDRISLIFAKLAILPVCLCTSIVPPETCYTPARVAPWWLLSVLLHNRLESRKEHTQMISPCVEVIRRARVRYALPIAGQ
ncbi:hypothetical protein V8C26DRAFT_413909 [Trichoderma gracile]